jgi:hypothetical protein
MPERPTKRNLKVAKSNALRTGEHRNLISRPGSRNARLKTLKKRRRNALTSAKKQLLKTNAKSRCAMI